MSGFAKAQVSGGRKPKRDPLASLKMTQLEVFKPALPAEIMESVIDYLNPVDLISVARSCKRMREMVYEDSRWVQRLKKMGCWNDAEARKHAGQTVRRGSKLQKPTIALHVTPPDQAVGTAKEARTVNGNKDSSDGFDAIDFTVSVEPAEGLSADKAAALTVMRRVQSIRGKAREEYGKIHAALNRFYEDIVSSEPSTDCLVFKIYNTPENQAQILSELLAYAKGDLGLGRDDREQKVVDTASLFETAALREFRSGYESEDIDGLMRKYAYVLVTLNGGNSAVDLFIHHNHLVTKKADFGSPSDCIDQDTGTVSLAQTQAFLTRFGVAYNEEISIINRCFPSSKSLPTVFLEKMGKDVLAPYFSALFDEVHERNIESYLNTVSGTCAQLSNFLKSLQPTEKFEDELYEAGARVLDNLFEPHVDLYLAEELGYFRKLCDSAVSDWDRQLSEQAASAESLFMSNVNRQADKKDFLTSFKKVLMMPVNILPSFSASKSNGAKEPDPEKPVIDRPATPNRFSTFGPSNGLPSTPAELPTTELAAKAAIMNSKLEGIRSLFSIEVALSLVHAAKASLERTAQFVRMQGQTGKAAQQQCEAIFVSMLDILGHRHVISGFDQAVEHLSAYKPRHKDELERSGVEPLVTFLELVNVGDLIQQMMDVFYEQELIGAKITDRSDFLDPAVKGKKKFEQMLDERVAAGLNKGIDVLMEEVDHILATKQTGADFNPESAALASKVIDIGPSEAAKGVVDVVSSHTQMLVGSTDKSTLDVFNQEIGLRLFASLCKHLKMQRISVEGAIKLISDMNHYFGFIQRMKNEQLLIYFTALRELSQVYLIDPSDSKEMATIIADVDRFHGIFRAEEVYDFASRRADWYQVKKSVERAMFGIGCVVM